MKTLLICLFLLIINFKLVANEAMSQSIEDLLNEKVSTASKFEQRASEAPASVVIITADDIKKFSYHTVAEAINSISGFYLRNDRNYTYLGARGFENLSTYSNKILLMLNGHILNDNVYGGAYFANDFGIDIGIVERIEIIRGPGSSIYGTGAMLAVINVITYQGKDIDGAKVFAEYGSFGHYAARAAFGKKLGNDFSFLVSGSYGQTDGENLQFDEFSDINYGKVNNLDSEEHYGLFSNFIYKNLNLSVYYNFREKEVPTAPWETVFNSSDMRTIDNRAYVLLKYNQAIDINKTINFKAYYNYNKYQGYYPYEDAEHGYFVHNEHNEGNWYGSEAMLEWDLNQSNRMIIGAEYQNNIRSDYFSRKEDFFEFSENYPFQVVSVYLQNSWQALKNLSFTLGLRHDKNTRFKGYTSPRASIVYNPDDLTSLKFIFGNAFRAPNTFELFYFDPGLAKANKDILPERITSSEIAIERKLSNVLLANFSIFHFKMNELIEELFDTNDSLTFFDNKSMVQAIGAEFDLRYRLLKKLNFYFNTTLQYTSESNDFKEPYYNFPALMIKTGAYYLIGDCFFSSIELFSESGRETIEGFRTKPYVIGNLSFGFRQRNYNNDLGIFNNIEARLKINNFLNTKHYLPSGWEHKQSQLIQRLRFVRFELGYNFK